MKFVNQSAVFVNETNPLKCIELAGKVTHKSEIKDEKKFLIDMLKMGHTATLEFGSVYIESHYLTELQDHYDTSKLFNCNNSFIYINQKGYYKVKIYTNLRYLLEKCPEMFIDYINDNLMFSFKFTPALEDPYRRLCYHITTNRGISHELVRHRVFSFMQESTRYCNYSNNKFGNELTMINNNLPQDSYFTNVYNRTLELCEIKYMNVTNKNVEGYLIAQQARGILPNDLKTELYMCGFLKDWVGHNTEVYTIDILGQSVDIKVHAGFDTLRRDKSAHPQCREIAEMIYEDIIIQISTSKFNEIKESYYE